MAKGFGQLATKIAALAASTAANAAAAAEAAAEVAALLPAYTIADEGKVLTVIDDGEGEPILSWETPA